MYNFLPKYLRIKELQISKDSNNRVFYNALWPCPKDHLIFQCESMVSEEWGHNKHLPVEGISHPIEQDLWEGRQNNAPEVLQSFAHNSSLTETLTMPVRPVLGS